MVAENLQVNLAELQNMYGTNVDIVFHNLLVSQTTPAILIYLKGLTDLETIGQILLAPLVQQRYKTIEPSQLKKFLLVSDVTEVKSMQEITESIFTGRPVLLVDGYTYALSFGITQYEKRSVEEPVAESVVRGPREGFTESIGVNTSLLRRKIKSPKLKLNPIQLGDYTQTQVVIAYIEGIAKESLIEEVNAALQEIQVDGIIESGYIEEMIEGNPYSPFPQIQSTERPDVVSASLLEGRVAILTDGTPYALLVPVTLFTLLQSSEDYYQRYMIGTAIRWMRYLFIMVALLAPSFYVAILTFHQEMVPTALLLSIARSREQIPFPALIEALLMEMTFEALREAGVRLPKQVGAAVSIVGALVIGQAATAAGLVSAPMVMVVAITGIASFVIPQYPFGISVRLLRFPIMFLSGSLGLLGLMLGMIAIVVHLTTLKSFGTAYIFPFSSHYAKDVQDVFVRAPFWAFKKRPAFASRSNRVRANHARTSSRGNQHDRER